MFAACRTLVPCVIFALLGTTANAQYPDKASLPAFPGPTPTQSQILGDTSVADKAATEQTANGHAPSGPIADGHVGNGHILGAAICPITGKSPCYCNQGGGGGCWRVPLRLSLRKDWGDGVGYENGYSYAEAFLPCWQPTPNSLLFTDLRVINYDDDDRWEFNAGIGVRACVPQLGGVVGWNVFYDTRNNEGRAFDQVGVGVEYLQSCFELRANSYFVMGDDRQIGFAGTVPFFDVAMDGVDFEIGAPVPFLQRFSTRGYVGVYHYDADGVDTADGLRGRLEGQLGNSSSVHLVVQHDDLFDTTVTGGVAIHFGAPAYTSHPGPANLREVLGQRVVRDINVVLSKILKTP